MKTLKEIVIEISEGVSGKKKPRVSLVKFLKGFLKDFLKKKEKKILKNP